MLHLRASTRLAALKIRRLTAEIAEYAEMISANSAVSAVKSLDLLPRRSAGDAYARDDSVWRPESRQPIPFQPACAGSAATAATREVRGHRHTRARRSSHLF